MNSFTAKLTTYGAQVTTWCLWLAKLLLAIAAAYLATRLVGLGTINIGGTNIPFPVLRGTALEGIYVAEIVYGISR